MQRQRCSTTQLDEQTAQTLIDKLDALSEDIREHSHQIRAIGNIHNQIARALHEQRRSGRSMGVSDDVIRSMTRSSDELIHREQSYTARVAAVHHEVSRCLR